MRKALLLTVLVVATTAAAPAAPAPRSAAETLDVHVRFGLVSDLVPCPVDILPADVPADTIECRARSSTTVSVRGLGTVSQTYSWPLAVGPPTCPAGFNKPLAATGRLHIAEKGELTFTLAEGARCALADGAQNEPQEFTITGGTGPFAGASGRGTVAERSIGGGVGSETWTGSFVVPGLEFDLTAPKFVGVNPKTIRAPKGAKTAKVTYNVKANDAVDGPVPTVCRPKSGSRFKVGRTTVRCEATDSSGNTGKAAFAVTVRRALAERAVTAETGTLAFSARVAVIGVRNQPCPPGYDTTTTVCAAKTGNGTVPGLGKVSMSYFFPVDEVAPGCPSGHSRALGTDVRVVVSGKGELTFRTAPSACLSMAALEFLTAKQEFTIAAGTGIYAGASGTGTVTRNLVQTAEGASGTETWSGTLVVAGLEFNLTSPSLSGATAKTVRVPKKGAKSARVTFKVTATDDIDGAVPVSCQPKSGSRFKVGRTKVSCSATDSSGNTAQASFVVTVKPRR